MFFLISKTAYFLMMPLGLLLIAFITGWISRRAKVRKYAFRIFFFLLVIFTNPFLANEIMMAWEYPPKEFNQLNKKYDLAIVLTGVANNSKGPSDRVYFNKGADRVTHTVQLYKKGIVKKILVSGGHGAFVQFDKSEAENLKSAFLLMGVPPNDVLTETESKNTYQSAVNCQKIVEGRYSDVLLITSSFHLKRANGCFKKTGTNADIFPVDFYSGERNITPRSFVPNHMALVNWSVVFHEVIGIVAYWAMGYL